MSTTIVDFYRLNDSDTKVEMVLTIGHGQESSSDLSVDGMKPETGIKNSFKRVLESNKNLKGKTLRCVTTVQDIQASTDQTSILLELSGGVDPYSESRDEVASPSGTVVSYSITIYFI